MNMLPFIYEVRFPPHHILFFSDTLFKIDILSNYSWHTGTPNFPGIVKNRFINEEEGSHPGLIFGTVEFKHHCANIFILEL